MKWVFGKTYVYYIVELDALYTASYLPMPPKHKLESVGHKFMTLRDYGDLVNKKGSPTFFNPNITLLVDSEFRTTGYTAELIGVL